MKSLWRAWVVLGEILLAAFAGMLAFHVVQSTGLLCGVLPATC